MAGGRPSGPKTRNNNQWSEAKYKGFIKNQLRSATRKWPPISQCLKDARVARGVYRCAGCHEDVPASTKEERKKVKNVYVDHIQPIVDPEIGWTSWDETIERMFCEADNLQLLCKKCHDAKTSEERTIANERRKREKEEHIED